MDLLDMIPIICPLSWYQEILLLRTIITFPESDNEIRECLNDIIPSQIPISVSEILKKIGSIGYNYLISNLPLSRTGLSLANHGIIEKFAIVSTFENNVIDISRKYFKTRQDCEIVIRNLPIGKHYIYSVCICEEMNPEWPKVRSTCCKSCINRWTPLKNSWYPELLIDSSLTPPENSQLLM